MISPSLRYKNLFASYIFAINLQINSPVRLCNLLLKCTTTRAVKSVLPSLPDYYSLGLRAMNAVA